MLNLRRFYALRPSIQFTTLNISSTSKGSAKTESTPTIDEDQLTDTPVTFIGDEISSDELELEINRKRNKSRLLPQHRNMLNQKTPYDEPKSWIHLTEKYQRMQFGRYGLASGVDPRICYLNKTAAAERAEYESIAYPDTLQAMVAMEKEKEAAKVAEIQQREESIAKKMDKLAQWKKELNDRINKKEADAKSARDRKERLIEEVRRHFGFTVDPKDERFKEMLEQKQKEDKKKQKEAKKQAKEAKMIAKLSDKKIVEKLVEGKTGVE